MNPYHKLFRSRIPLMRSETFAEVFPRFVSSDYIAAVLADMSLSQPALHMFLTSSIVEPREAEDFFILGGALTYTCLDIEAGLNEITLPLISPEDICAVELTYRREGNAFERRLGASNIDFFHLIDETGEGFARDLGSDAIGKSLYIGAGFTYGPFYMKAHQELTKLASRN